MAKLYFRYGAMGSSKSANILMVRYNYEERGQIIRKESCGRKMSEIRIQEVQEGAQLMDKLVELLTVGTKWFSDKADAADLAILDKRINERAAEGWELVTYDYMATSMQIKGRL